MYVCLVYWNDDLYQFQIIQDCKTARRLVTSSQDQVLISEGRLLMCDYVTYV